MRVVPSVVAVVAAATVAAAVLVVHHDSPVKNAGQAVGYVAQPAARSLAVIGDSYSSGTSMGGIGDTGWPAILAGLNNLQLSNHAVAGAGYATDANGSSNAFPQQAKSVVKQDPSYVIVWGARDDLTSGTRTSDPASRLETIAAGMKLTLDNLQSGGVAADKILVIGPTWINADAPAAYTQLSAIEAKIAATAGVTFVPTVGQHAWFAGNNASYIGQDGEHPTDAGEQHIAYLVQNALIASKILPKAPAESDGVPAIVPTVTATVTPAPKTVTVTTTAPATATPTVTVTTTPTATITVLAPP